MKGLGAMRERWTPVAVVAGVLLGVNALGRITARLAASGSDRNQIRIGLGTLALIALIMIVIGYRWAIRYRSSRVAVDVAVAVFAGCLASILVGPFVVGSWPFREGAKLVLAQLWQYPAVGIGGAVFGFLIATALGRDHKSRAWQRYAETVRARPRRVVRR
jgi:hypothetical protein